MMKYHILGEHPRLGQTLSGRYTLGSAKRNKKTMERPKPPFHASTGWTYQIVRCLAPDSRDCGCSSDDTFEIEEA